MNKILCRFAFPVLLFAFASAAQSAPVVVNFDDQPNLPQFNTGFFEYARFQMNIVDTTAYPTSGYASLGSLTSSGYVISNWNNAQTVNFAAASGETFDLNGFDAVSAWLDQTVTIVGFFNGMETYQEQIRLTTTASDYTFTGFTGIDRFEVRVVVSPGALGNQWALNNISVTPAPSIPEPEAYVMLLAGLGIVVSVARRRRIAG